MKDDSKGCDWGRQIRIHLVTGMEKGRGPRCVRYLVCRLTEQLECQIALAEEEQTVKERKERLSDQCWVPETVHD